MSTTVTSDSLEYAETDAAGVLNAPVYIQGVMKDVLDGLSLSVCFVWVDGCRAMGTVDRAIDQLTGACAGMTQGA